MIGIIVFPVYRPFVPALSRQYATEAIQSGWISWRGKYAPVVEKKLSEILGAEYVLLTSSGTMAMNLVARCLRHFKGAKRILVPNSVFVAAWNSFVREHYDMCVMGVDPRTWNADLPPDADADAILIVHNVGNVMNVPRLKKNFPKLVFVEDACEAFFGNYEGYPAGSASFCSAMSFFANKSITSGEGGAFITNDKDVADFARKVRGQGQGSKLYHHEILGSNYRMTNVQAAILLGQLESMNQIKEEKARVFDAYKEGLDSEEGIQVQEVEPGTSHANWIFAAKFVGNPSYERAKDYFTQFSIDTRPMFVPISKHPYLRHLAPSDESIAHLLSREVVMFPSYPELPTKDIWFICDKIRSYVKTLKGA